MHQAPARSTTLLRPEWMLACAAGLLGALYAAVSAYWGVGGTALLDTIGGTLEREGRGRAAGVLAVVWITVILKLAASGIGLLAVAQPQWLSPVGAGSCAALPGWPAVPWCSTAAFSRLSACWCKRTSSTRPLTRTTRRCDGTPSYGIPGSWSGDCCWRQRSRARADRAIAQASLGARTRRRPACRAHPCESPLYRDRKKHSVLAASVACNRAGLIS